jgi:predicted RNA-binding protein with PIN domain
VALSDRPQSPTVKIIFSGDESADDRIRHIVSKSERKKQTIIVTDDRELQDSIKMLGAQVLAVKDFLVQTKRAELMSSSQKIQKKEKEEEKYISKTVEYKINNELTNIWLKKNK